MIFYTSVVVLFQSRLGPQLQRHCRTLYQCHHLWKSSSVPAESLHICKDSTGKFWNLKWLWISEGHVNQDTHTHTHSQTHSWNKSRLFSGMNCRPLRGRICAQIEGYCVRMCNNIIISHFLQFHCGLEMMMVFFLILITSPLSRLLGSPEELFGSPALRQVKPKIEC